MIPNDSTTHEKFAIVLDRPTFGCQRVHCAKATGIQLSRVDADDAGIIARLQPVIVWHSHKTTITQGVKICNSELQLMTRGYFKSDTISIRVVGMSQVKVQRMLGRVGFK